MNKKNAIAFTSLMLMPVLFFVVNSFFQKKLYHEHSIENLNSCLESAKKNNLPIYICSNISSSTDAAYASATAFYNPIIFLMIALIFSLGLVIVQLSKELKAIKENLNV